MIKKSMFMFLSVLFVPLSGFSMECSSYFSNMDTNPAKNMAIFTDANGNQVFESRDGAEVLAEVIRLIGSAKKGSTVYLFTPEMKLDSIGTAILMQMVSRTSTSDNIAFKVHFSGRDHSTERLTHFFNESSKIQVFEKNGDFTGLGLDVLNNKTFMLVETESSVDFILFDGALSRVGLKNNDLVKEKYTLFQRITTSSFRSGIPFRKESLSFSDPTFDVESFLQLRFVIQTISALHTHIPYDSQFKMTLTDRDFINKKSYELAVQLYKEMYGKPPSHKYNTLEILNQIVQSENK